MTNPTARLLDVESAALYLGVNDHYVRRLVRERRVTFVKIGHLVRFDVADLDALIDANRRTPF